MDKLTIKPVPFYQCDITIEELTLSLLQIMDTVRQCYDNKHSNKTILDD
jgi:hypothetical protein